MTAHRLRKPTPWVSPRTNLAVSSMSASQTTSSAAKIADSTWVKTRTNAGRDMKCEVRPAGRLDGDRFDLHH